MGQSETKSFIEEQYQIIKPQQDGSALLRNRHNRNQFLLRNVCSNIGEEIKSFEQLLQNRQVLKSPHLLQLVQVRRKQEKNVCSVAHKVYLLIEYPFKTLKDEFEQKIQTGRKDPFAQAELWSILYSCSTGLKILYELKISHECLTAEEIFISRDGLIKISDPMLLGLEKNYIKLMKKQEEYVHISPELMNFMDDYNFSYYDKEKSDVFILGCIILESSLLKNIKFFNKTTKRPLLEKIPELLTQLKLKYSRTFVNKLSRMLHQNAKMRPTFREIVNQIEGDNSLFQQTQSTQWTSMNATGKSSLKGEDNFQSPFKSGIHLSGSVANHQSPMMKNEDTLIKQLQTSNHKSQLTTPQQIPIHNQHQYPQFIYQNIQNQYFHPPQPQFHQPPIHPVHIRPLSNHHQIPNSKSTTSYVQSIDNNQNSYQSQKRNIDGERFSVSKFGNIQLKKQEKVPIFSHEIPEINEILKMQRAKNSQIPKPTQQFQNTQNTQNIQNTNNYIQKPSSYFSVPTSSINLPEFYNDKFVAQNQHFSKSIQNNNKLISTMNPMEKSKSNQNIQISSQIKKPEIPHLKFDNIHVYEQPKDLPQKKKFHHGRVENGGEKNLHHKTSLNRTMKLNDGHGIMQDRVLEKIDERSESSSFKLQQKTEKVKINIPSRSPGSHQSSLNNTTQKHSSSKKQFATPQNQSQFVTSLNQGSIGKYEGYMKNGMRNGQGRLEFFQGGFYSGQWKDDKMHGYGKLHYENGRIAYEGNWKNNQFSGHGRIFNESPEKMLGSFNYRDFSDIGDKWVLYEGDFQNDCKHGKGKIRLSNGQVFQGLFVEDSIEGEGIFYTTKGQAVQGFWKDNILQN